MSRSDRGAFIDHLCAAAIGFMVAAVAIYVAVKLIEAVWATLLLILIIGVLIALLVGYWQRRSRGW